MAKEPYTKYTCDNCKKEKFSLNNIGFPYHNNWCYIYNFTGKVLESHYSGIETNIADFKNQDKHFCCEKCMFEWIKKTIDECKKDYVIKQKINNNEPTKQIWDSLQKEDFGEAIQILKNSKLI